MARRAMRLLTDAVRSDDPATCSPRHERLDFELMVRASDGTVTTGS
jgi:DNA-binding LacI/PurR family transcriptional regulator